MSAKADEEVSPLPGSKILVIDSFLIIYSSKTLIPIESAQLRTSSYGFAKLEIDGVRHDHAFLLYRLGEVQQVLDGDCLETFVLARAIADKPGHDGARELFVSHVDVLKTGSDEATVGGM
jgi:hypothetical protein